MTHATVHEWGHVLLGQGEITRGQADALMTAARAHPLAHDEATNILIDRRDRLIARQMVGIVAAKSCSLEILPKVDPAEAPDASIATVRRRLIRMLDVALGLDLAVGDDAAMARQDITLLEILIRAFADKLLAEVRRGLPRQYVECEGDLATLRGRLNVARQFTINAVRPDRLACRFDQLNPDTPLMRVMAAAVSFLSRYARTPDSRRKLNELRLMMSDVSPVAPNRLPWKQVQIDRTNFRWRSLFRLAQLLLRREWQATHHSSQSPDGLTLLFPMNDLFEKYVAALMRRALGCETDVVDQGGLRACLGAYTGEHLHSGEIFRTKPDLILRRNGKTVAIIDTKWKKIGLDPLDRKHGVQQSDVYQLMAYARLYETTELMLLYPEVPGRPCGDRKTWGLVGGKERLRICTIDVALPEAEVVRQLKLLCDDILDPPKISVS